jgi:hypothetical protein
MAGGAVMNHPLVMLAIMLAGMVFGFGIGGLVFPIVSPHPTPRYVGLTIQNPASVIERRVETLRPIIIPPTGTGVPPPYWSQPETEMSP